MDRRLIFIAASLYFTNNGADFTVIDLTGFGVMTVVASALLMLAVYLPTLYTRKRRLGGFHPRKTFALLTGLVCNLPIFLLLAFLINRKMAPSEAIGFMLAFLITGVSFGLGFTLILPSRRKALRQE